MDRQDSTENASKPTLDQALFMSSFFGKISGHVEKLEHDCFDFKADVVGRQTGSQLCALGDKIAAIADGCVDLHRATELNELAAVLKLFGAQFSSSLHRGDTLRSNYAAVALADVQLSVASVASVFASTRKPLTALERETKRFVGIPIPERSVTFDCAFEKKQDQD